MLKNSNVKLFPGFFRGFLLLFFSSLLIACSPQKETPYKIDHFEPKKITESEFFEADLPLRAALRQYQNGNFKKAGALMDEILVGSPSNDTAHLYGAISHLATGDLNKARLSLQWLSIHQPNHPDVNWYLGLTYLAKGDNQRALPFFVDLKNVANPYQSKAVEILESFPEGKLFLVNTTFDNVYHVGHKGFDFASYFQVAKTDLLAIRSSEDERQLFLRYNIPVPNEVTVRLYDEQGTLQYIEKLSDVEEGAEKKMNLIHLEAGGYNLEVKLDSGRTLNQRIEIHERGE